LCVEKKYGVITTSSMNKTKIKKIPSSLKLRGKVILLRVDFNVPLEKNSHGKIKVVDNWRIKEALPQIVELSRRGAKTILITHAGRPNGRVVESLRLAPIYDELEGLLPPDIPPLHHNTDWNFNRIEKDIENLEDGDIYCLENVRFKKEEEANDKKFAEELSTLGDIYVNEAFSVSHRAHASLEGLAKLLPAYAGSNLLEEIETLSALIKQPKQPFVVIVGGAKVEEKLALALSLTRVVTTVLTGGVVANTVLKELGHHLGRSKVADSKQSEAIKKLSKKNKRSHKFGMVPFIQAPVDVLVTVSGAGKYRLVNFEEGDKVRANESIVDIGPRTVQLYAGFIRGASTLVWNGPMGLIEKTPFDRGTKSLAQLFASRSKGPAFGVVGGGDLLSVFDGMHMEQFLDYRSTAGGAMLDLLSGKKLPALEALKH
jgi:phosphoglycerate kinase